MATVTRENIGLLIDKITINVAKEELDDLVHSLKQLNGIQAVQRYETDTPS